MKEHHSSLKRKLFLLKKVGIQKEGSLLLRKGCGPLKEFLPCPDTRLGYKPKNNKNNIQEVLEQSSSEKTKKPAKNKKNKNKYIQTKCCPPGLPQNFFFVFVFLVFCIPPQPPIVSAHFFFVFCKWALILNPLLFVSTLYIHLKPHDMSCIKSLTSKTCKNWEKQKHAKTGLWGG